MPGGDVEGAYQTVEEIANPAVAGANGSSLTLGDVGTGGAARGALEEAFRYDGQRAALISITIRNGENVFAVRDAVVTSATSSTSARSSAWRDAARAGDPEGGRGDDPAHLDDRDRRPHPARARALGAVLAARAGSHRRPGELDDPVAAHHARAVAAPAATAPRAGQLGNPAASV